MHFKFFATLKPENQQKEGENFVKANFLSCLPKEKTFKQLSLNYCEQDDNAMNGRRQMYTQEEADRMCDALLALSINLLYIGVLKEHFHAILP